ncbi:SirB2 family protein [Catenovulum maritimum]|uniref:Invasion protein n=1 Tax=Catenovulum maritimum TaxID=1513271 RepID=A0A0J8JM11_9ALTE|nr:SirB2 family protein [Catenovulum maritimum]KMT65611.1 hypothetical protein XM47_07895 [Catenovulum maritimum]
MGYLALKHSHMLFVGLSVLFFSLRLFWHFKGSNLLQAKLVKILPHVVDTFLLLTAFALMLTTSQYPFELPWLTEKLFSVISYIAFGILTFKIAKNIPQRIIFSLLTYASLAITVHLAISKQALILS